MWRIKFGDLLGYEDTRSPQESIFPLIKIYETWTEKQGILISQERTMSIHVAR